MKRVFLMILLILAVCSSAVGLAWAQSIGWANPAAVTVEQVGQIDFNKHAPYALDNLYCDNISFREVGTSVMKIGCFTPTAFGLMDVDASTIIFNGTDESLPLIPYTAHQILVPWPNSSLLIVLDPAVTGGVRIRAYKNPAYSIDEVKDIHGKLIGKRMRTPPELTITDSGGKPLVINPQTLAFPRGGNWLVAETLGGSFVRVNPSSLQVDSFAQAFGSQGSPALLKSSVAVDNDGRFVAIYNKDSGTFRVYDLANCDDHGGADRRCVFHDYINAVTSKAGNFTSIKHIRFVNENLLSFEVKASDPAKSGLYELAPAESIGSRIEYLALGDSYTSGEGAFDYLAGTDTATNTCHLSLKSYPLLLANDLFGQQAGYSVACSGARINDVASNDPDYRGQVRGGDDYDELSKSGLLGSILGTFSSGYVAQQHFVSKYQPAVLTVSIGGNDIGFGDILAKCILPHLDSHSKSTCFNSYEDRLELKQLIDSTRPRLVSLLRELVDESPISKVYVLGYPEIAYDNGRCANNVRLNHQEILFSNDLVDYMDQMVANAANESGVGYIDISKTLSGYRMCEISGRNVAVNGLTLGKDAGALGVKIFGRESYHPNAWGHQLIEQSILAQTNNLRLPAAAPKPADSPNNLHNLLDAPKSNRTIYKTVPVVAFKPYYARGERAQIKLDGAAFSLKAATKFEASLGGPSGRNIGALESDKGGNLEDSVIIPIDAETGLSQLDITGPNLLNEQVDFHQSVYIYEEGSLARLLAGGVGTSSSSSALSGSSFLPPPPSAKSEGPKKPETRTGLNKPAGRGEAMTERRPLGRKQAHKQAKRHQHPDNNQAESSQASAPRTRSLRDRFLLACWCAAAATISWGSLCVLCLITL